MDLTGNKNQHPLKVGMQVTDIFAALNMTNAILLAYYSNLKG